MREPTLTIMPPSSAGSTRISTMTRAPRARLAPVSSGYADVNGIKLYHEIYGQGEPLVLLHGGLMTIGEMFAPLEPFAKTHKVIAVELQGHGRTADTDRPLSFATLGDDIAALLDHLNIAKTDIVGLSLGAAVVTTARFGSVARLARATRSRMASTPLFEAASSSWTSKELPAAARWRNSSKL